MGRSINQFPTQGDFNIGMSDCSRPMPVKFDSVYYSPGSSTQVITLAGTSGILNPTQISLLNKNVNSVIKLEDRYYRLQMKNRNEIVYIAETRDLNSQCSIRIYLDDYSWEYELIQNEPVEEHIANADIHVQAGERDTWNNKLNYEINGGEENLILNRN